MKGKKYYILNLQERYEIHILNNFNPKFNSFTKSFNPCLIPFLLYKQRLKLTSHLSAVCPVPCEKPASISCKGYLINIFYIPSENSCS